MPLVAALAGMLLNLVGSVAGRALLALGMGFVTYKGMNGGIDWLFQSIKSNINLMDPKIVQFLAFLWVDKAISMMFGAFAAALVVKMAGGSTITKLVTKGSV